jgi:hypothetical protein
MESALVGEALNRERELRIAGKPWHPGCSQCEHHVDDDQRK